MEAVQMLSTSQLDLTGISWPVCLLKFKQNLLALRTGQRLEVLVQDPDVADHIVLIVDRSEDRVLDRQIDGKRFRLCIQKG
jgi:TusA-related sulfurtransferase